MVDFLVAFGFILLGGLVCFGLGYYQGYKGLFFYRKDLDRLARTVESIEEELNDFSDADTQRFWDKLLGFEKHYDGEQGP